MDGMHDLGGKQGFGRVRYSLRAQTFHEPWEKRVNALYSLAVKLGIFNMDEYRHAIERMEPRHYLSASYYERSLTSLATLCVEKGILTREELERRAEGSFRVRDDYVPGHVRMPGYIRGKTGVVVDESPAYPFPDAHAHGIEAADEPTYDVRFDAEELWPNSADPAFVHVGVFQSYLERVE